MATYFAHSINQVDKDGLPGDDCLSMVLANPGDKALILQAIRDNLMLMNQMRDDAIAVKHQELQDAIAERDALGSTEAGKQAIKDRRQADLLAKKAAIEKEIADIEAETQVEATK